MNISEISIRNNVFAWMLMAALLVFGGIAFDRMGVSQMPDVDFPVVTISVELEGAAPEVMELDVIDPIEGAITAVEGVLGISSTARTGSANISVEFGLDKDVDVAVQELQSALSRAQRRLPSGIEPPSIRKSNPESSPIMWLGVSAENLSQKDLMKLVRDQVQDRFSTIPGIGEVTLGGYVEPELRVWIDHQALLKYQLTASDVVATIQREHSELPGGRVETKDKEFSIRTLGEAPSISDFENIMINRRAGSPNFAPFPIKAVAKIEDGTADPRSLSRTHGKISVGLGIRKQPGANAVSVAHAVKERLAEVQKQLPKGVDIGVRFDSTLFIEEAIGELNYTLLLSAILTALVCWLFLGSMSATMNVVLAIPTSVVGSFIILYALGFTLNTFTLLGLSLAIGIVVDDAIMVLENIVRHKEMGKSRIAAALDGSKEIWLAAMAATAAIIAIFLPVAFMEGIIGKYFLQFGVTLSVAVALSLLEALTLTPMRCSRFLTVEPRHSFIGRGVESFFSRASQAYASIIRWTLSHKGITLVLSLVFFTGTFFIGKLLKREFVPPQDQSRLMMRLQTPVGSSLSFTDEKMKIIEKYLDGRSEISSYFGTVGGFGSGQVNTANLFITLKDPKERDKTAQELLQVYRNDLKGIPDLRVTVQDPSLSGFTSRRGFPVEFTIQGPSFEKLVDYTHEMMKAMEDSKQMTDVDTNYQEGVPEFQVFPDREKARLKGVDVAEISQTINVMMAGQIAGKYSQGGRRYDVRVSLPRQERSPDFLSKLRVRNNRGELVPLSEVAKVEEKRSLQAIFRENRHRAISIQANVAPGSSQAEAIDTVMALANKILPPDYHVVLGGSAKTFQDSFQSLVFALLLGILVSYMVLGSQFNSFIHPITILIALPFSMSGAFVALFLGGQTLNIFSMIGLILLMGIVKKNSILLVEFTNHKRAEGLSTHDALLQACPIRLRPILMTSIATIAGAIPAALAIGPGAESRIPMALAVIGGVLVSTALTLFLVPTVYALFDKLHKTNAFPKV